MAGALLGWECKAEVMERAKLLARMVPLIIYDLQAKSYEQFVPSFSNPGAEPDAFDRSNRQLHFQMRISPTCRYDASASYSPEESPWIVLQGGGDDFGVMIIVSATEAAIVDSYLAPGQGAGCDARDVVRCLRAMPGFGSYAASLAAATRGTDTVERNGHVGRGGAERDTKTTKLLVPVHPARFESEDRSHKRHANAAAHLAPTLAE
jgi:hypothetical protein